jgi:hypothetical protein
MRSPDILGGWCRKATRNCSSSARANSHKGGNHARHLARSSESFGPACTLATLLAKEVAIMAGWCHETLITLSRKAIMKKLFVCAATAVLLLSLLVGVSTASASDSSSPGVNQKLSAKQIEKRFAEINSSYQLGEPLSDEDAEFVRTYATPAASGGVSPMATQNFNRSGSGYGVSASFYGSVFSNIGLLSCSFGGNVTCTILSGYLQWQGSELHITQTTYWHRL